MQVQLIKNIPIPVNPRKTAPVVNCVEFSPDGSLLASASDQVRFWDPATGKKLGELLGHKVQVCSLAFFPDGKTLVSLDSYGIRFWDIAGKKQVTGIENEGGWLALSPDGKVLAMANSVYLSRWDVADIAHPKPISPTLEAWDCVSVAFSSDGKLLAFAGVKVELWKVKPFQEKHVFERHGAKVYSVAFSPDDKVLASGSLGSSAIKLWSVTKGKGIGQIDKAHKHVVNCVRFSPDGRFLASGGNDGAARIWDWQAGRELAAITVGPTQTHFTREPPHVACLAFSPDGKTLAIGGLEVGGTNPSHPPFLQLWGIEE